MEVTLDGQDVLDTLQYVIDLYPSDYFKTNIEMVAMMFGVNKHNLLRVIKQIQTNGENAVDLLNWLESKPR